MDLTLSDLPKLLINLNSVGVALSAEKDHDRLLEIILMRAKDMTNADGGTLYLRTEDNTLKFEIVHTDSLGIRMGGVGGESITFYPIKLVNDGKPNMHNVAACAVLKNETINIPDAYTDEEFDFTGTRQFDKKTGYRSQSFLTVPMTNHENEIIGVLQLINAKDSKTGEIRKFSTLDQQVVESLASQAAVTLTNRQLIEAQKNLFDSFIELIASAIDEKSPYTAGHCRRVPVLTNMIAEAVCNIDHGPHKDFSMTEEDKYELSVAGWLHDCGKITTPEAVVDKGTKLETIIDRIEMIDTRFEVLKRDAEIAALKNKLKALGGEKDLSNDEQLSSRLKQLDDDREFIRTCNVGGEAMADELQQRVGKIAQYTWTNMEGNESNFLTENEVYNLNIFRGTLTAEEREIINNHIVATIKMLESLPYPKHLLNVTEFAGGHHEKMDGTGYPNGLTRYEMSVQARMMGIADIFEALTAGDRPYKKAMPMSQALTILGNMKLENHIDPDLFDVFMWEKVYQKYCDKFLTKEQCDDYDLNDIPGYVPPPE